ncbi:hypothetical protein CPB86DRAFT_820144 [Serendipita vermifera]|nr:hypothetical protein CPB86DRAFT_820144 [Serendipita vermifera]
MSAIFTNTTSLSYDQDGSKMGTLNGSPPRLFALIIGIDEYKSTGILNLEGAKNDARAMEKYLLQTLGVPASQIQVLLDNEATRDRIKNELQAFKEDERIKEQDPILIYYAGHGSEGKAPAKWGLGDQTIQLLVPHDAFTKVAGETVFPIPDRTIGSLLEAISKVKGDNITVIFDCCHSGSLTRIDSMTQVYTPRSCEMLEEIPPNLDEDIWSSSSRAVNMSGFLRKGLRSHVLLAACGAREKASECQQKGVFTPALLSTLGSVDVGKITYEGLINRLPCLPAQNPQCEGFYQDRIWFQSKAPNIIRPLYPVQQNKQENTYTMHAGIIQGVSEEAIFAVYNDRDAVLAGSVLGYLTTSKIRLGSSTMTVVPGQPPCEIMEKAVALQTSPGKESGLSIYLSDDDMGSSIPRVFGLDILDEWTEGCNVVFTKDKEQAHVEMAWEHKEIVFNILDPHVTVHGLSRMPYRIEPSKESVQRVLDAASNFYWHLRRISSDPDLIDAVDIEFRRIQSTGEYDDDLNDIYLPHGSNLIQQGIVDLVIDGTSEYGITITNKTEMALYASLFYFDNCDFSITPYTRPPTSRGRVDAPLPPKGPDGIFTIGYGSGGIPPLLYTLREGQSLDVGFLKLFLSTEPAQLSSIVQPSPFTTDRMAAFKRPKVSGCWHTVLIPLVQRKYPLK